MTALPFIFVLVVTRLDGRMNLGASSIDVHTEEYMHGGILRSHETWDNDYSKEPQDDASQHDNRGQEKGERANWRITVPPPDQ